METHGMDNITTLILSIAVTVLGIGVYEVVKSYYEKKKKK
jgi:uncharacterized protein YoxC